MEVRKNLKRNEKENDLEDIFSRSFKNKNVPLLILDEKWLEIFPEYMQTPRIRQLASGLADLLKQQGRSVDELKGLKRYKSQMMQEIVENMDADNSAVGRLKRKKLDKNQKKILELNQEMEQREDELVQLPYEIREINTSLLLESTMVCYERFRANQEHISEADEEIAELRERLKLKLLDKQDKEMKNEKMYSYLHAMLGAELMERLDGNLQEKKPQVKKTYLWKQELMDTEFEEAEQNQKTMEKSDQPEKKAGKLWRKR